jgi:hypothetical protein
VAGFATSAVEATLGAKNPLEVELTSSIAEASGAEPSELMPTFWAFATVANAIHATVIRIVRMVFISGVVYFISVF